MDDGENARRNIGAVTMKVVDQDYVAAVKLAIEMHKSGKTIAWIRNRLKASLRYGKTNSLPASFIPEQFAAFDYDYKKREKTPQWKKLHQKPDSKLDAALEQRRLRCERYFEGVRKDDDPEAIAREDGFPAGWAKHIGGDDEYYDIYIDRYSKLGVTVWKDRGGFWWWRSREETEPHQTLSKYEAIDAAESWIRQRR